MKIEDTILIEVLNTDISAEGRFEIPKCVTQIGDSLFQGCTGLTALILNENLTQISAWAFQGCTGLTRLTLNENLIEIGIWAFQGCTGLTALTLNENLIKVGTGAFQGCTSLTALTLNENLIKVGTGAFEDCTNLNQVIINTNDLEKYKKIKALLPEELQEKTLSFELFMENKERSKKIQSQCLQQLMNQPETNFLYQVMRLEKNPNHFFKALPAEMVAKINGYMKNDNWYYVKAQKEFDALPIPHSEQGLEDYRKTCEAIVAKYLDSAENRVNSFEQKADICRMRQEALERTGNNPGETDAHPRLGS